MSARQNQALARSAHKLPKDAEIVVVEGGSHRGFGSYKSQPLDWQVMSSCVRVRD
ncbi:unnamed protein product, partial [Ectocarpus sp. 8 AP-2014]